MPGVRDVSGGMPTAEELMALAAQLFARWENRFPARAALDRDPRDGGPCCECGTTFAWHGYEGRCGWCYEATQRPRLRVLKGGAA